MAGYIFIKVVKQYLCIYYTFWSYNLSDKIFSKMCMNHIMDIIIQKSVVLRQTRWFDCTTVCQQCSISVSVVCVHPFPTNPQRLLEGGGLVLSVFDDGGVWAAALAAPHLLAAAGVPVLISGLSQLGSHLHQMVWVGLHQRLSREQAQICACTVKTRGAEEGEQVQARQVMFKKQD